VNKVCFCFPFPFFPFPVLAAGLEALSSPFSATCPAGVPVLALALVPPAVHTVPDGGTGFRNIFLSETFPLTVAFCLADADEGNSGKREFDSFGGGCNGVFRPEGGLDDRGSGTTVMWLDEAWAGVGIVAAGRNPEDALLADHGVLRWPCRKAVCNGPAVETGSTGKRSTGLAAWLWFAGKDDPAACATRSHTCREER